MGGTFDSGAAGALPVLQGLDNQGTVGASTTNTTRIQAAIDSIPVNAIGVAGGGSYIQLPKGDIYFDQIILPTHIGIRGFGIDQTRLLQAPGNAKNAIINKEAGDQVIDLRDFRLECTQNSSTLGGIIFTGTSFSKLMNVQVQGTKTDGIAFIGSGIASTGDAMNNECYGCWIMNIVSGNHLRLGNAANGGSHPDGFRWFGGIMQSAVGIGIKVDAASADTSGFLAADSGRFYGLNMQGVPTPVQLDGGSYFKFDGFRCEVTTGTMTLALINTRPTNNPTQRNIFRDCSFATYGDPTKFIVNDAGIETAFAGCIYSGGWL